MPSWIQPVDPTDVRNVLVSDFSLPVKVLFLFFHSDASSSYVKCNTLVCAAHHLVKNEIGKEAARGGVGG